jgi:hypothetical protein
MRRTWVASLIFLAFTCGTHASPDDDKKACVIDAAQKLPAIAGLQIVNVSSSVTQKPSPSKPNDALIWQINIDFTAAQQEVVWSFLCAMMPDGNPRAQRIK